MIGRVYTVKGAQLEMNMIAEGYYAALPIYERAQQLQIKAPLLMPYIGYCINRKALKKVLESSRKNWIKAWL